MGIAHAVRNVSDIACVRQDHQVSAGSVDGDSQNLPRFACGHAPYPPRAFLGAHFAAGRGGATSHPCNYYPDVRLTRRKIRTRSRGDVQSDLAPLARSGIDNPAVRHARCMPAQRDRPPDSPFHPAGRSVCGKLVPQCQTARRRVAFSPVDGRASASGACCRSLISRAAIGPAVSGAAREVKTAPPARPLRRVGELGILVVVVACTAPALPSQVAPSAAPTMSQIGPDMTAAVVYFPQHNVSANEPGCYVAASTLRIAPRQSWRQQPDPRSLARPASARPLRFGRKRYSRSHHLERAAGRRSRRHSRKPSA